MDAFFLLSIRKMRSFLYDSQKFHSNMHRKVLLLPTFYHILTEVSIFPPLPPCRLPPQHPLPNIPPFKPPPPS